MVGTLNRKATSLTAILNSSNILQAFLQLPRNVEKTIAFFYFFFFLPNSYFSILAMKIHEDFNFFGVTETRVSTTQTRECIIEMLFPNCHMLSELATSVNNKDRGLVP